MSSSTFSVTLPAPTYRHIARQLHDVLLHPIDGITLRPNEGNMSTLEAEIIGPEDTPFAGGHFILRLVFEKEYPNVPPKGYFLTRVFHPNISERGEICVNTLKRDWSCDLGIRHILLVIRCLLIEPNAESALNEEAARLLLEDYHEFARRAKMMTTIHATHPRGDDTTNQTVLRPSKLSNQDATSAANENSSSVENDPSKASGGAGNANAGKLATANGGSMVRKALRRL